MLREYERAVIFRFGSYHRISGPGWTIVLPFIEEVYQIVDVRTQALKLPEIKAFTSNEVFLSLSTIAYFRIVDVFKAVLRVRNYLFSLRMRLTGQVRNYIGRMLLGEVFARIDVLNEILREEIGLIARDWGMLVEKVEILSVKPPEEIVFALYKPVREEYMLMAARFQAEARKVVIEAIGEAARTLDARGITLLYLKALEQIAKGRATKVIFPLVFTKFIERIDELKGFSKDEIQSMVGKIVKYLERGVEGWKTG